ncbi:MAG TPA: leucyl/phenylalanyl-tRNA--protein transferase [Gammaproteobacteria bacterium]|nr:leucyl/phenylalanyl-tRNA--protein transferase [Gammaproteobacteria bacterium]
MIHQRPFLLRPGRTDDDFPDPALALDEPDGLLAVGGDLSPRRLLKAYRRGIFPWYGPGQPVLWWSPNPRSLFLPGDEHVSRSLRKRLRRDDFHITHDRAFETVIEACAAPRDGQAGTWITPEMRTAYVALHRLGHAHSVECWIGDELAGGLYGVAVGRVFFGESMFCRRSNASKLAFVCLARQLWAWGYGLIDAQVHSGHIARLGARKMPREQFLQLLERLCPQAPRAGAWRSGNIASDRDWGRLPDFPA